MGRTQHGELELVFEKRGDRTVLVQDFQRTPLQIVRPFELEPGVLTAIIINPTTSSTVPAIRRNLVSSIGIPM